MAPTDVLDQVVLIERARLPHRGGGGGTATVEEREAWLRRAAEELKSVSGWARDTLNEEIASPRSKRKP